MPEHIAREGDDRRSFLIKMGESVLGMFLMPTFGIDKIAAAAGDSTDAKLVDEVRTVLRKAIKLKLDNGEFALMWMEDLDGKATTMCWAPKSEQSAVLSNWRRRSGRVRRCATATASDVPPR
jgi:hypothetical protein